VNQSIAKIKRIFVHCSYTTEDMDIGVEEIRKWHTDPKPKGNGWADIGYHNVIRRGGVMEYGRAITVVGAHVLRANVNSIGICLVGGKSDTGECVDNFDVDQKRTLKNLLIAYNWILPNLEEVMGHGEYTKDRGCPCFDIKSFYARIQAGG